MADDIRLARWDLHATAGVTESLEFVSPVALESLSVYVGGTVTDVDDLTDATEYAATLGSTKADGEEVGADRVATVALAVPAGNSTALRLVVDGAVETVGRLTPSTTGSTNPDRTIDLTADSRTYEVTIVGQRGPAGETGPAGPQGETGPAGPAGSDATVTTEAVSSAGAAMTTANLSDLTDPAAARTNLDVYSATQVDDAIASGTSTEVWLPASRFSLRSGSPSLGTVTTDWQAWLFDASLTERVAGIVSPVELDGWINGFHMDIFWTNAGAGAGDVRWGVQAASYGEGDTLSTVAVTVSTPVTAPAQNVVKVSTLISNGTYTDGDLLGLVIYRDGGLGTDTLPNDAALLGVRLRNPT